MTRKYVFDGWSDDAAVECAEMDAFIDELIGLCSRYGIAFELYSDDFSASLIATKFDADSFSIFYRSLDDYRGGVPWLDEARQRFDQRKAALCEEYNRRDADAREQQERQTYERLRNKYEGRK